MFRIVPGLLSLEQHLAALFRDPERYRPPACATCGLARPWAHGCYTRKSDRPPHGDGRRNPIPILRYRCRNPACRVTCSRLPACIPPRRWYLWVVQQAVLLAVLSGTSLSAAARHFAPLRGPARSTLGRWQSWLKDADPGWAFHLKARFPELARCGDGTAFWTGTLEQLGLIQAMTTLDGLGECVP